MSASVVAHRSGARVEVMMMDARQQTDTGPNSFVALRDAVARRAQDLALLAETDDELESAILFADQAMHDDQAKVDMLDWCLANEPGGGFLGFVLDQVWHRPKIGSIISQGLFDRDEICDAFYWSHPRYLMSEDADHALWLKLRRKRNPITVWLGVSDNDFELACQGLSWTTSRAYAEWFATRFATNPLVVQAQIRPIKICAAWLYEHEIS
jgi:hypothetical protein